MKVSMTLSLSCVLLGLAAMPTLAQQKTDITGETNSLKPLTISAPKKAATVEHGPIRMAPVSILPASLRRSTTALCQDRPAGSYFPERGSQNGITVGGFLPVDAPDDVDADLGFSISLERIVAAGDKTEVVVSLRYSHYSWDSNTVAASGDINLISPTVGYRYRLGASRRFYIEPNIGIVFVSGRLFSGNANHTDFAYGIGAGYDWPSNMFADLRYVGGGNSAEHGFVFSLGRHF